MAPNKASVNFRILCLIIFSFVINMCNGLNCRSHESRKEEDFKNIFMTCLKRQEGRNSSNRYHGSDNEWRENQSFRKSHSRDSRDDRNGYREDSYGSSNDRTGGYREDSYDNTDDNGRQNSRNDRMGGRNENRDKSRSRDRHDRNGGMGDMLPNHDRYGNNDHVNGREDFQQSSEFGDVSRYNSNRAQQRYKRSRNPDKNSGQRSQYNPNTSKQKSWSDDKYRNEKNSSEDNGSEKDASSRACALHCFLENLEMTASDGMPDKYLTTHALTKDVTNEDLRDFLQESVEECFQILDNENTEDKCEFSKNLLLCLSEKGRANCDDWRDDETQIKIF